MYNVVIIGGGIIGLSVAIKLKELNRRLKVAVLEKEKHLSSHQSKYNSGVIHSGIYYPSASLKAKTCLEGYSRLITFCDQEEVPYKICGKLIVATSPSQLPTLNFLARQGEKNGLKGIKMMGSEQIREREPHVRGIKALSIPQTGVVDYSVVANKFAEKFRHFMGEIFPDNEVTKIHRKGEFVEVVTPNEVLTTRMVINCSGLHSDRVGRLLASKPQYRIIPFRGEFYKLSSEKNHLIKHLVYPVPKLNLPFLGPHFSKTIGGEVKVGPNAVLAFKREGYHSGDFDLFNFLATVTHRGFVKFAAKNFWVGVHEWRRSLLKSVFLGEIQKMLPEIQRKDLAATHSGVRAMAFDKKRGMIDDFFISEGRNYINVGNVPSPAATSCLAIGEHIARMTKRHIRH